jgi:hypothetical protein
MSARDRLTEILQGNMSEVNDTAALLGVIRQPGESEETFRTRTAYVMHLHMGLPVTGRILLRMAIWGETAILEREAQLTAIGA